MLNPAPPHCLCLHPCGLPIRVGFAFLQRENERGHTDRKTTRMKTRVTDGMGVEPWKTVVQRKRNGVWECRHSRPTWCRSVDVEPCSASLPLSSSVWPSYPCGLCVPSTGKRTRPHGYEDHTDEDKNHRWNGSRTVEDSSSTNTKRSLSMSRFRMSFAMWPRLWIVWLLLFAASLRGYPRSP